MGANSSKTNNTPYTVYISPQRMLGAPGLPSLNMPVRTEKELVKAVINTGYMVSAFPSVDKIIILTKAFCRDWTQGNLS